ncbi:type II toxin-antitoxin system PemK/MazF family toxin [Paenibacillus sp. FSL H3-0333]|uniref:type II toxin-antitoxin system PemK/MazF family toxin n=1 Tax=Paenibacillus sp. FSL H3-0333 TaxID=2921373 RepID=UPI0030F51214
MIRRYDMFLVDLGESNGSVQRGTRPAVVISNDTGNKYSSVVVVSPVTSSATKSKLPTHVHMSAADTGVAKDSIIQFEQHITVPKSNLKYKLFTLPQNYHSELDRALMISLGLDEYLI